MTIVGYKRGNVVDATEKYIAHQCNCTTRLPHGLSKDIATRYPECDVYSRRGGSTPNTATHPDSPGTIKFFSTKDGKKIFVSFLAQWAPGRPLEMHQAYPPPPHIEDTHLQRTVWFQECLRLLEYTVGQERVAVPYNIGCILTGGNRTNYETMLQESNINFVLYVYDPKIDD